MGYRLKKKALAEIVGRMMKRRKKRKERFVLADILAKLGSMAGRLTRKNDKKKKERLVLSNILTKLGSMAVRVMRKNDKEREEQLALANILSKIVLPSPDITEVGKDFTYELMEFVSIDWAAIGLIDESKDLLYLFPLSPKLSSDWEHGNSIPLNASPFSWLRQHKKALVEPNLAEKSQFWTGSSFSFIFPPLFMTI